MPKIILRMKPFTSAEPVQWKKQLEEEDGVLIDVRTADEFEDSYIEGSLNIDVRALDFDDKLEKLDKQKSYFVYCRSGVRSNNAMEIMRAKGFSKVYNLDGGIMKWEFDGYEVEYGDDF